MNKLLDKLGNYIYDSEEEWQQMKVFWIGIIAGFIVATIITIIGKFIL